MAFFADYKGDYQIVDTDYTSYAVVYACTEYLDVRFAEYYFVLTRDPIEEGTTEYTDVMNTVGPIFDAKLPGYDWDYDMRVTKQGTGCTYYN